jgi:hypothetical protein
MGNRIIGVGDAPKWTLFSLPCKLVVSDRDERGVGSSPVAELTLIKHLSPDSSRLPARFRPLAIIERRIDNAWPIFMGLLGYVSALSRNLIYLELGACRDTFQP